MAERKKRPATYADIERLPEHLIGEILNGELIVSPRPAVPHTHSASFIGADLMGPFVRGPGGPGGPGGWWIMDEPELHLHGDVVVPDIAGWRRERMAVPPRAAAIELAPDWVCEVVSPGTARLDRIRKMPVYAREGVGHLWLVDPLARTLEVFRRLETKWVTAGSFADDEHVRPEPFAEVEIDLSRWWLPEPGEIPGV
jgi:Uma2 family endonuclease